MRKRSFRKKTFDAVRDEVERDLAEAVEFARRSPFPEPSTVGDYV